MLVNNENITVVIQGPLYIDDQNKEVNIFDCIRSIKENLPHSKIVISTWENEKKHDDKLIKMVDKILYLESPESIKSLDFDNNILKQIKSSIEGLKSVKTQFALKIRSNIILDKKTEFFDINDLNKINLPALVPNPITSFNLFALPDFVQFGTTEMLKKFWDIQIDQKEFFTDKRWISIFDIYSYPHNFKYTPEQYVGIAWIVNNYNIKPLIKHKFDVNYVDFLLWKDILKDDFNFYSIERLGFTFYPQRYTYGDFLPETNEWIESSSRKQFISLLLNKYLFCFFNKIWIKQILKSIIYGISPKLFTKLKQKG